MSTLKLKQANNKQNKCFSCEKVVYQKYDPETQSNIDILCLNMKSLTVQSLWHLSFHIPPFALTLSSLLNTNYN